MVGSPWLKSLAGARDFDHGLPKAVPNFQRCAMASHFYQWDNTRIHYRKSGLGDPILLVHGLYPGASSEEFDHNIRSLSQDFRVYAIDLLGFGESDAPHIRYRADLYPLLLGDFIRDVIGAPTGVIAAGASASFAASIAAMEPELVTKIVFISPQSAAPSQAGWLWEAGRELLRMLILFPPLHLLFQEVMAGEWEIGEMLRRSFREKTIINSAVVARISELARLPGVIDAYASLELGLLSLPLDPLLPQIVAPALFISGTCVSPKTAQETEHLSQLPQNGRLEWIERAAEWAHFETPNSTNRVIASFLTGESVAGTASVQDLSKSPKRLVA
jgi:pimeloyl-ACP methyl ester carboxylesterase